MAAFDPLDEAASPDPVLGESLAKSAADGLTGVLQVVGDPGGTVYLSDGGVVGVKTPGAPSLEVIVLRSGRIPDDGWDAAFSAAAAGIPMAAELITRGLIGAGELEALLRTAVADALFVLACGYVDQCRVETSPVSNLLPLDPPAEVDWLLAEAERRMNVLAAIPGLTGYQRARVEPAAGVVTAGTVLGGGRDELLALANGRRTPRDLAFALGRGVYATTLELGRMQHEGLLVTTSHRAGPALPAPPRAGTAPVSPAPADPGAGDESASNGDQAGHGLPRRRRGRHSEADAGADMSILLRLLRPRSSGE